MPTTQRIDFPFVSGQQGGRGGFTQQILKGLRLAALFTEPADHRLARLQHERRERESEHGIAFDEERLALDRRRESRLDRQNRASSERDDLARQIELFQQSAGPGLRKFSVGGEEFTLPNIAFQEAEQRKLEEEQDELARLAEGIPLQGPLAPLQEIFGEEVERASPEQIRAAKSAIELLREPEETPGKQETVTIGNKQFRITYDEDGNVLNRVELGAAGQRISPTEQRIRGEKAKKSASQKFIRSQLNKITPAAQTFEEARSLLLEMAESDEKVAERFVDIEQALAEHYRKIGLSTRRPSGSRGGLDPRISQQLQALGGVPGPNDSVQASEQPGAEEEFEAYFKRRFGGR